MFSLFLAILDELPVKNKNYVIWMWMKLLWAQRAEIQPAKHTAHIPKTAGNKIITVQENWQEYITKYC